MIAVEPQKNVDDEGDPWFHVEGGSLRYYPNRGQLPFHDAAMSVKFRGLFGGTGSGKTLAGIVEDCRWCLKFPGIVGYIFEPTYKMIDRIVVPTLNNLLGMPFWNNPVIKDFNRGRMNITWYNGSTLWLVSLDDPEQAEGGNLDFAHADEARLVKPEAKWQTAWRVIMRRLRGSAGDKYPTGAWVTTTPNQPGSALYNFFENPKTKSPEADIYRIHLDDNIKLSPEFREGIKRDHSGSLYKRFVEGLFAGDVAATFAFDYAEHVSKFVIPEYGDIAYGVDFGWCYSEDTEVLTSSGWLRHNEIKKDDFIATFDPHSNLIIWDKPKSLYKQYYEGDMIEVDSRASNFFVTPHHKCWIGKQGLQETKFDEKRIKDVLAQRAKSFVVKVSAQDFSGDELDEVRVPYYYCERKDRDDQIPIIDGDVWLKFIAWFISEGCAVNEKAYGVYFTQLLGKKSQMIDEVMQLLPYKVHRREYVNEYGNMEVRWQITCKELNKWLRKNCGVHSKNKKIPDFVFGISLRQRFLFIETLLCGDGTIRKNNRSPIFSSSSYVLLDQIQKLAIMSGFTSTKRVYSDGMGRVSFIKRNNTLLDKTKNIKTRKYSGMIYCFTTNTGYYITRRNGKPAFQGNTDPNCIVVVKFDNDRRAFVVDEFYENRLSDSDIADKCHEMVKRWGAGVFWCDPAAPDTIDYLRRERINAKPANRNRDEGIREIGGRLQDAGDGRHRLYVSDTCINLIDELQSYNMERKGHDHAVDALRYCLLSGKRRRDTIWGLGSLDQRRGRGPW